MLNRYLTLATLLHLSVASVVNAQYNTGEIKAGESESFKWPDGKHTAVSLTFDDARLSQPDKGIPVMDKYGVRGTFYVSPGNLQQNSNDPLFCDMAQLSGIELDGKSFEEVKKLMDSSKGKWLVLAGHETDIDGAQTTLLSTLGEICKYASDPANGIWIDNMHNIASYIKKMRHEAPYTEMLPYLNPALPVEIRIDDLLGRMTLEEKIGQLNMPCVYQSQLGENMDEITKSCRKFAEGKFIEGIGPGGGFFTMANNIFLEGPVQQANSFNEFQQITLERTRLKIPLLQVEEGTHGLMCSGATIFPEGLALGSTWNMDLIENIYSAAAEEARAVGIHALNTLVIEPNRDPRLGRNQEGYSEDPFLCSSIAKAIVQGCQGQDISGKDKVIASLCHYPGQSQPVSGLERGAMEISERTLREVFLPPWEAGIRDAGALGVMVTYPTIDGTPAHASSWILNDILRGELGFKGLVLSEGEGVQTLIYEGLAKTEKEAGALAAKAGMDISINYRQGYFGEMVENVKEGKVSMQVIDRSVRRVLNIKYGLGLFDNPFVNPDLAATVSHTKEHQELALQAAREAIVLLKNDQKILPLSKSIRSVAVIGPNADNDMNQLGDYTSGTVLQEVITVLDGIRKILPASASIKYVKGCSVTGDADFEPDKAVKAARNADICIVVLGENEWQAPGKTGTDGEGYDVATLELTGHQQELLERIHATGTPVIVILINGRPLAIPWIKEHIPAVVEAWIPGEKGGDAVAGVLFGDYNPSGRLSITFPRHAGQLPVYYNHKPSKDFWIDEGWGKPYADLDASPLFEFGFGLGYTEFDYQNMKISPSLPGLAENVTITAIIKNTGKRTGAEVVQLYLRDKISSVVTPVKQLKGFEKIFLSPGEEKTVTFTLTEKDLRLLDENLHWKIEPGEFEVMIGSSSRDIRLRGSFIVQ